MATYEAATFEQKMRAHLASPQVRQERIRHKDGHGSSSSSRKGKKAPNVVTSVMAHDMLKSSPHNGRCGIAHINNWAEEFRPSKPRLPRGRPEWVGPFSDAPPPVYNNATATLPIHICCQCNGDSDVWCRACCKSFCSRCIAMTHTSSQHIKHRMTPVHAMAVPVPLQRFTSHSPPQRLAKAAPPPPPPTRWVYVSPNQRVYENMPDFTGQRPRLRSASRHGRRDPVWMGPAAGPAPWK